MPARRHTDEQIAEAVELHRIHGPAEAARRTGIAKQTIASWARRRGVQTDAPMRTREATEVAAASAEKRRAELADLSLMTATRLVQDMYSPAKLYFPMPKSEYVIEHSVPHPTPIEQEKLARAAGVLIDRVELLSGRATGRVEGIIRTPEQATGRIVHLSEVLRRRAEQAS